MHGSSRRTDAAVWTVRVVAGPDELLGKELRVEAGGPQLIGRADDCALPLADQSMSRRHASVEALAEGLRVADNGSANGVVVDGVRVPQAVLGGGGRFTLGTTTLEVIAEQSAGPLASPETPSIDRTMAISDIADLVAQFEKPSALEELGEPLVMTANKPMVLNDPEAFFLVVSGKVELFTVQLEAGEPRGARTHFLTADAGHAFFGMDTDRYGMGNGFLAVGKAGSRLAKFSLARLMSLSAVEAHRDRIAALIATWVEGLSRRLTKDVPAPGADLTLAAGTAVDLAPGKKALPERAPVWIEMPAARFLFDDMASLSWEVEGVLFPLAQGSWVELLEEDAVALAPRATAQAVADPRLWAGLEVFHRVLCECEFVNKKLAIADEYLRLEKKADQVEEAREVAYNAIGSVLGGTGVWERPAAGSTDLEPVFRACLLIGKNLGVAVKNHPDTKQQRNFEEQVLAVAQTSRIRTRKVALAGEWWTRDSGPLLAQYEATKAPVAILPVNPKSYEAVDPASGQKRRVDAAFVKQLEPFAYTFYRGFGDGVVTAKEMLRFGVRGLGREFRSVALMGIGLGVLGMLTPMITGRVFDTAIPQAERSVLMQFALGLFLVALTQSAFKITQSVAMLRVQGKMDYSVQAAVWDRLLELPMTFYRKFSSGDLAERAAGVDQMRAIIAGAGVAAILGSLSSVFNVFQMASYDFKLAAVGIGLTLAYVTLTTTANWVMLRFQRDEQRRRGRITGLVLQLISGVAKLRVVGAENHAFRVWATEFAAQRKVTFRVGRVKNLMAVLNASFPVISSMAIFLTMMSLKEAAAKEGSSFTLTTGDFLAFNAAFGVFLGAMQALGDASLSMLRIVPTWERLTPIVQTLPEIDATKAYPGKLKGELELAHVSFRYSEDSPWILQDVSLKIKPGEFVALVGGSGSGKSTLLRLMLGFEKPGKGGLYYDGQDLANLDVRMVRAQLGVVLQDSRLLPTDIFRNIVGTSSRTVQEAWEAATMAGLAEDVKAMPMGMHTYISEGGGGLSGGQKQRLMIARAIVNKPKILFLDEATSALDNKAQAMVTESINRLAATRIVIAHRLSTIQDADRICYLEQGVIKEQGTYAELMAKDGLFATLAKRQMG